MLPLHHLIGLLILGIFTPDLASYEYTLNAAGIRTGVQEVYGGSTDDVTYTYDDLYRLTEESRTGVHAYTTAYTYDPVGNRLSQNHSIAGLTSYSYNNRDQLTTETAPSLTQTYSYDANGRLSSKTGESVTSYDWQDNDRLVQVDVDGAANNFSYNAEGMKVAEGDVNFLWDPTLPYGNVLAEYDNAGDVAITYVFGLERLSQTIVGATEADNQTHTYLADGTGSVRFLTDESAVVTDSYGYTAFGEELYSTGSTANRYKYNGEEWNPNVGFTYLRARWLNNSTGQFLGMDPWEGCIDCPETLPRYHYAESSPLSNADPSGESTIELNAAISVKSILATVAVSYTFYRGLLGTVQTEIDFAEVETGLRLPDWILLRSRGNHRNSAYPISQLLQENNIPPDEKCDFIRDYFKDLIKEANIANDKKLVKKLKKDAKTELKTNGCAHTRGL